MASAGSSLRPRTTPTGSGGAEVRSAEVKAASADSLRARSEGWTLQAATWGRIRTGADL